MLDDVSFFNPVMQSLYLFTFEDDHKNQYRFIDMKIDGEVDGKKSAMFAGWPLYQNGDHKEWPEDVYQSVRRMITAAHLIPDLVFDPCSMVGAEYTDFSIRLVCVEKMPIHPQALANLNLSLSWE